MFAVVLWLVGGFMSLCVPLSGWTHPVISSCLIPEQFYCIKPIKPAHWRIAVRALTHSWIRLEGSNNWFATLKEKHVYPSAFLKVTFPWRVKSPTYFQPYMDLMVSILFFLVFHSDDKLLASTGFLFSLFFLIFFL